MVTFYSPLDIRFVEDGKYLTLAPLLAESKRWRITVSAGLVFNGASIPSLFHFAECPMSFAMAYASALHDPLYGSGLLPRKECDRIFYEALVACGMPKAEAFVYWKAVRLGGEAHYRNPETVSYYRELIQIEAK